MTNGNSPMSNLKECRLNGLACTLWKMEGGRRQGESIMFHKNRHNALENYCLHTGGFDSGIFLLLWLERGQPSSLGKWRLLSYYKMVLQFLHRHSDKTYIPFHPKRSKRGMKLKRGEQIRRGSVTSTGARGWGHRFGEPLLETPTQGQSWSGPLYTRSPSRFLSKYPLPPTCRSGWRSMVMSCCSLLREQVLLSR